MRISVPWYDFFKRLLTVTCHNRFKLFVVFLIFVKYRICVRNILYIYIINIFVQLYSYYIFFLTESPILLSFLSDQAFQKTFLINIFNESIATTIKKLLLPQLVYTRVFQALSGASPAPYVNLFGSSPGTTLYLHCEELGYE